VTVTPVYDSSATLVTQLREGAPADVIATADLDSMQTVVEAGDVHPPTVFASNRLVMVTPRTNPANITSFDDLSRDGTTWVACVGSAPCGKVARALIELNRISSSPSSLEVDVKAVLTKVTSGEADAGLVYATDAVAAGSKVRAFPIPGSGSVVNQYAAAVTEQSGAPGLAQEWTDLVTSAHGQQVLSDAGFGPAD
jgi:molybdate transport system substrate-binding protein